MGHEVIAFTEHETISNAIKIENYYKKIKKEHPNFKVIFGNEIYLCRDGLNGQNFSKDNGDKYFHFILLAKDAIGHKQIRELSTRAWMRSYKTGKMRRVPTYYQDIIDKFYKLSLHLSDFRCFIISRLSVQKNAFRHFIVKLSIFSLTCLWHPIHLLVWCIFFTYLICRKNPKRNDF